MTESFQVTSQHYHWLWPGEAGSVRRERGNGQGLGDISLAEVVSAQINGDSNALARFELSGHLKTASVTPGIKFFITVPPLSARRSATLRRFLDPIVRALTSDNDILEQQVYIGKGREVAFIIEGLVGFSSYQKISLISTALAAKVSENFDIRTTTFLSTGADDGTYISDGVFEFANNQEIKLHNVEHYLTAPESDELEHKSSLEVDMDRYLATGEITSPKSNPMLAKILGTIVAFLNTRGGTLVIGALEDARFNGEMRKRLEDLPQIGPMRVCGINREYNARGWDGFYNKLIDLCAARIGASLAQYIKINRLEYEGKDVCVIQVPRLPPKEFAYLDGSSFYVRNGATTRLLNGREQEEYQSRARLP
jgi:hypothetical protein